MAFTAKDVQALREKTGVGMMDCKKALTEADGDFDRAIDILRERGLAAATKKAGRITAEGVAFAFYDEAQKTAVLLEVNSETDFVAKNEEFQAFVADIAHTIVAQNPADVEALLASKLHGSDRTVEEARQEKVLSIGENLSVRRFARVVGHVASYVHAGGSMGVLVEFKTDDATAAKPQFLAMGKDVAMQVASMSPQYLNSAAVPADVIAHEKQILLAQMAEDPKMAGKPEKVLESIVQGKIAKFFKEVCLLEQAFVKDSDISVGTYVQNTAKELGATIEVLQFVRYVKGENLQKREDDFAAEVAKAAGKE